MRHWSRREMMQAGAVALASMSMHRSPVVHARMRSSVKRPRYFVHLLLSGGIDPIYTTDPKRRRDVARGVDLPYPESAILSAGDHRLGPHLAPIARHAGQLTILNGALVYTANHATGFAQASRFRTRTTHEAPTLFDIIGAHRDADQPLSSVFLNVGASVPELTGEQIGPSYFGTASQLIGNWSRETSDVFTQLDAADPDHLRVLAGHLDHMARDIERAGGSYRHATTAANLRQVSALYRRMPACSPFQLADWKTPEGPRTPQEGEMSRDLQRALWLLEEDLTSCVWISLSRDSGWDSHLTNHAEQTSMNHSFFHLCARFLDELDRRKNRHGSLSAQTAVVACSEIGRFPLLNPQKGKDHFPQIPILFAGPWFASGPRGRSFGATGTQMEALPIDLRTGAPAARGGDRVTLDDIGATLLTLARIEPELYGYNGRVLDFLVS